MTDQEVLQRIRSNPYTLLIVARDRSIVDAMAFVKVPETEELKKIMDAHPGHASQFFLQGSMSKEELNSAIDGLVRVLEWDRSGKLKPGTNLVKDGRIESALAAARRRLNKTPPPS